MQKSQQRIIRTGDGTYLLSPSEGKEEKDLRTKRDEANRKNKKIKASDQLKNYARYRQHAMRPLARQVVRSLTSEEQVSFAAFNAETSYREHLLAQIRVELRKEDKKVADWRRTLKGIFTAYKDGDDQAYTAYYALSANARKDFEALFTPEGAEDKSEINIEKFINELGEEDLIHVIAALKLIEQEKEEEKKHEAKLTAGIREHLETQENLIACKAAIVAQLVKITSIVDATKCPEYNALSKESKSEFERLFVDGLATSNRTWHGAFVDRLPMDELIAIAVAFEKAAIIAQQRKDLRSVFQKFRSPKQVVVSPEYAAMSEVRRDSLSSIATNFQASITEFVGRDQAQLTILFKSKKKDFKEQLEAVLFQYPNGVLPEFKELTQPTCKTLETLRDKAKNEQRKLAQDIVSDVADEKFVEILKRPETLDQLTEFLLRVEYNKQEEAEINSLLSVQKLHTSRALLNILNADAATVEKWKISKRTAIKEYLDALSPEIKEAELAKLCRAQAIHSLLQLERVGIDQFLSLPVFKLLSDGQREQFKNGFAAINTTRKTGIKQLIAKLKDDELLPIFKAGITTILAKISTTDKLNEHYLLKHFRADFTPILTTFQTQVSTFVASLDATECRNMTNASRRRAHFAALQQQSVFAFEHDCIEVAADVLANVTDSADMHKHPVVVILPTDKSKTFFNQWSMARIDRGKLPKTQIELEEQHQECDFVEQDTKTGDVVVTARGRYAKGNFAQTHFGSLEFKDAASVAKEITATATEDSEQKTKAPNVYQLLEQRGTFIGKSFMDAMQAETSDLPDCATASLDVCWITPEGNFRSLNASVGDLSSYVVIRNIETGAIKLVPLTLASQSLAGKLLEPGQPSEEVPVAEKTAKILRTVAEARKSAKKIGIPNLGFDNLREKDGQLFVVPPGLENGEEGLSVTGVLGNHRFHDVDDEHDDENTITLSPEAAIKSHTEAVDLAKEEVFVLQHGVNVTAAKIKETLQASHKTVKGKTTAEKSRLFACALHNVAAQQERPDSGCSITLRMHPVTQSEHPVVAVLTQGKFGSQTATTICSKAQAVLETTLQKAADFESQFKYLDDVELPSASGFGTVSLGKELRELNQYAEKLDAEAAQPHDKIQEVLELQKAAQDAREYVNEALAVIAHLKKVPAVEIEPQTPPPASPLSKDRAVEDTKLATVASSAAQSPALQVTAAETIPATKPKYTLVLKDDTYRAPELAAHLEKLESYRKDNLNNTRGLLGKLIQFWNGVTKPLRWLLLKLPIKYNLDDAMTRRSKRGQLAHEVNKGLERCLEDTLRRAAGSPKGSRKSSDNQKQPIKQPEDVNADTANTDALKSSVVAPLAAPLVMS